MHSRIWIRILCVLVALAVLLPTAAALAETTKVATYMLRLREKPSTSAKVLDAYRRGTRVTILKKGSDWTKVRVGGKVGYMQSDKLQYAKYSTDRGETISKNTKNTSTSSDGTVMYILKGISVNLREDKSSDSEILGTYRGGTKVTVYKKGKIWSYVQVKGKVGYMATEFLTPDKE